MSAVRLTRADVERGTRAYRVRDAATGRALGFVDAVVLPSHTRRGHDQVAPWWSAQCVRGHTVSLRTGPPGRPPRQIWMTRREAVAVLQRHARVFEETGS